MINVCLSIQPCGWFVMHSTRTRILHFNSLLWREFRIMFPYVFHGLEQQKKNNLLFVLKYHSTASSSLLRYIQIIRKNWLRQINWLGHESMKNCIIYININEQFYQSVSKEVPVDIIIILLPTLCGLEQRPIYTVKKLKYSIFKLEEVSKRWQYQPISNLARCLVPD